MIKKILKKWHNFATAVKVIVNYRLNWPRSRLSKKYMTAPATTQLSLGTEIFPNLKLKAI